MSSAVELRIKKIISNHKWDKFCKNNEIKFSPNTVGGNVYYYDGYSGVEITLDNSLNDKTKITVSSFYMQNLKEISKIVKIIKRRFGGRRIQTDPELKRYFKERDSQ